MANLKGVVNSAVTRGFLNSLLTYPEDCKIIWRAVIGVKLFMAEELLDLWDVPAFACLDYL